MQTDRSTRKNIYLLFCLISLWVFVDTMLAADSLKILTFNTWKVEDTQPGKDFIVKIVLASQADIVGFQELSCGQEISDTLGWHLLDQTGGRNIISRFPIKQTASDQAGVKIELAPGKTIWLFNAHLPAWPYQPYDLRDGKLKQDETSTIEAAEKARGAKVALLLKSINDSNILSANEIVFITGDFNEPSCLDWTEAVAKDTARTYDLKVNWPVSRHILDVGFKDSFRTLKPDPVSDHGYSWTPRPEPNEVFDRIDIVYYYGNSVQPVSVCNIGPDITNPDTDIEFIEYPSDHRAVLAEFLLDYKPADE